MDVSLANRVADEALIKFHKLPKTGKPNEDFEWTILAAVALVVRAPAAEPSVRIVALGTGTKCLGGSVLSSRGELVNDSHAEVLARRAFLRYLLEQIETAALGSEKRESIFEICNPSGGLKFKLKEGHTFHFFTTHSPCGDASIFERADRTSESEKGCENDRGPPEKRFRRDAQDAVEEERIGSDMVGGEGDIFRNVVDGKTGGKLLQTDEDGDLMAQTIGAVRTKPGRGERTLSVSCSDKLARWSMMGVQGALLMMLLEHPVYLESIVLCAGTDHSVRAIQRAIWGRFDRKVAQDVSIFQTPYRRCMPVVIAAQNGELFNFRKNRNPTVSGAGKYQPSPCGIIWCDVSERPHEVEVSGRRHGVTKRKLTTPAARLRISKIELFARFVRLYRICKTSNADDRALNNSASALDGPGERSGISMEEKRNAADQEQPTAGDAAKVGGLPEPQSRTGDMAKLSYAATKALSVEHIRQWVRIRDAVFERWTTKPNSLGEFFVDDDTGLPFQADMT